MFILQIPPPTLKVFIYLRTYSPLRGQFFHLIYLCLDISL